MTENEFIVGGSVSQHANDGRSFVPLLEEMDKGDFPQPDETVGDAGYGFEEVYEYLEDHKIDAYVKYPSYHVEKSGGKKYRFHYSHFTYDEEMDEFFCPCGKRLLFIEEGERKTTSGYVVHTRKYRCYSCSDCPYRQECTKNSEDRTLSVSMNLRRHQQKARSNLEGSYGEGLMKRRGYEIETVFGDWKHNLGFRRFQLRGLEKVRAELFIHMIAYNMRKLCKVEKSLASHFLRSFAHYFHTLRIKTAFYKIFSPSYQKLHEIIQN